MALVLTTMVFGQNEKPIYRLDQPVMGNQDRTGWIGGTDDYGYYITLDEGEKFAMRLPAAGALPTGDLSVTKVSFGWQQTGGSSTFDPNFRIIIYAGGNGDWINLQNASTSINRTYDTTVQGTVLYEQTYMCESNGWQMVTLDQPVQLPANQEIWIAVQALGSSCTWLAVDEDETHPEWWGQHVNFYYRTPQNPTQQDPGGYVWWCPAWSGNAGYVTGKYALKALIDNGEAYVPVCDWRVDMYSLETADDQEDITYLYIDEWMMEDSLYLAPALWNMGPDTNISDGTINMYVEGTEIVFLDNIRLSQVVENYTVEQGRGWIFDNIGGLMAFSDMEEVNLTFPFTVCFSFETDGQDLNTSNNIACAEITDVEPDAIQEATNTLTVSPNPASTTIKVENAAGSQIFVYNIAGQEVMSVENAEANETLNVSNLNAGLYIVRVVNGTEVYTAKVSIVR